MTGERALVKTLDFQLDVQSDNDSLLASFRAFGE